MKLTPLGASALGLLMVSLYSSHRGEAQVAPSKPCGITFNAFVQGRVTSNGTASPYITGIKTTYSCSLTSGNSSNCGFCILSQLGSSTSPNGPFTKITSSASTFKSGSFACGSSSYLTAGIQISNLKPNTYYFEAVLIGPTSSNGVCSGNINDYNAPYSYQMNGPLVD